MMQRKKGRKGSQWIAMLCACMILTCIHGAALRAHAEEEPADVIATPTAGPSESSAGASAQAEEVHTITREQAIALAKTAIAQAHCFPEGRLDRAQVYAI